MIVEIATIAVISSIISAAVLVIVLSSLRKESVTLDLGSKRRFNGPKG
jgi:hypothetical protein